MSFKFSVLVFFYLILPANIALAGVEALFQHRIVRAYHHRGETPGSLLIISEGTLTIYEYSILVVLDTIISCIFFKSCKATSYRLDQQGSLLVVDVISDVNGTPSCKGSTDSLGVVEIELLVFSNEIKSRTLGKVHRKKVDHVITQSANVALGYDMGDKTHTYKEANYQGAGLHSFSIGVSRIRIQAINEVLSLARML
ncbi:hypothetical protein SADUNF_Sadunf11G0083400 [Salix dunnii]|uniref:Uncharacterized protein n=1 Tax=Salix dunnii TaxID=1413687 RepID=A0A835MQK1_9ROSI|nr:hypothetical protein SADUNF_Sadunf11G0083400 [Salix dunnii]